MNFAFGYLLHRFFFRITDFFHHWYMDGSKKFFHEVVNFLERLDTVFAVGINFRFFFQPLYKDFSIMGRVLGVIFRTIRILLGLVIYGLVLAIALVIYLFWISIPLLIIYKIIVNTSYGA